MRIATVFTSAVLLVALAGTPLETVAATEALVQPEPDDVVVSGPRPHRVRPWEVRIRPNQYAMWNLNQVADLELAGFKEKEGERPFPPCQRQGQSQVYRCGPFTEHPTEPGRLEWYQIDLTYADSTVDTIDPGYRISP